MRKPMTGEAKKLGLGYEVKWHNGTTTYVRKDRVLQKQGKLWIY